MISHDNWQFSFWNRKSARCDNLRRPVGVFRGLGGGGHPRGQFTGYVMDKTEEEVTSKVGKPDVVDNTSASIVKWTYKNKTFDPDNNDQSDKETILVLSRDTAGKLKVTDVTYNN